MASYTQGIRFYLISSKVVDKDNIRLNIRLLKNHTLYRRNLFLFNKFKSCRHVIAQWSILVPLASYTQGIRFYLISSKVIDTSSLNGQSSSPGELIIRYQLIGIRLNIRLLKNVLST